MHDSWKEGVLRETTNDMKDMVKVTRNGCVNLHQTTILLDLITHDHNSPLTQE
jgi:hypothetical protein